MKLFTITGEAVVQMVLITVAVSAKFQLCLHRGICCVVRQSPLTMLVDQQRRIVRISLQWK